MSKYYVNKFLFQVDRDPELLAAYTNEPEALVTRWERDYGQWLGAGHRVEKTSWLRFTDAERKALVDHDYVALFEMGAHFFLVLTIYIAIYDEEYASRVGPLGFQREYASKLTAWMGKEYPSVQV